ncbi:MAG TPA: hypothetical protein VEG39_08465 [Clostridia bacterium]|nr:hypothetical protein [Clostridia bacterium]
MRERELNRFWEREEPEIFEAYGLQFKLYRLAGKLQIRRFHIHGQFEGITLDRRAIPPEAAQLVKTFINLSKEKEMKK